METARPETVILYTQYQVTDCLDQFDHREKQLSNIQLENEKLKQILAEERRAMERLLPSFAVDQTPVPRLSLNSTPRAPFRQSDNSNVRLVQGLTRV